MTFQQRRRLLLTCILLVLSATFWQIGRHGGIVNVLHLPPDLDNSTPARQQGLTLLAFSLPVRSQKDWGPRFLFQGADEPATGQAAALWIDAPDTPTEVQKGKFVYHRDNGAGNPESNMFSARAYTSAGDILPLPWRMVTGRNEAGNPTGPFLLITIPNGYSNQVHFVDVNLTKGLHQLAHWRVTRLPHMEHCIAPPIIIRDTITTHGVTVSAYASRYADDHRSFLDYVLRPVLPLHSHQWDFVFVNSEQEWEPYGPKLRNEPPEHSQPIKTRNGVLDSAMEKSRDGILTVVGDAPYATANHFVRIRCELHQFETYDETVTFHDINVQRDDTAIPIHETGYHLDLKHPQSVTTPSGVTVSLPAQSAEQNNASDALNVNFITQPSTEYVRLPLSPLVRTYGRPVTLGYVFPFPFQAEGWRMQERETHHYSLRYGKYMFKNGSSIPPPSVPNYLKQFQITVRQRVELQVIPLTFIIPINDMSIRPAKKAGI